MKTLSLIIFLLCTSWGWGQSNPHILDLPLSDEGWVPFHANVHIQGDEVVIQGDPESLATLKLSLQLILDRTDGKMVLLMDDAPVVDFSQINNLYFVADSYLEDIEVDPSEHFFRPKLRIQGYDSEERVVYQQVYHIDQPLDRRWIPIGVSLLPGFRNLKGQLEAHETAEGVLITSLSFDIGLQKCGGIMRVREPRLFVDRAPGHEFLFPFEAPADPYCRLDLQSDKVQAFANDLVSVNNVFTNDNPGFPRNWNWDTPEMRNLLLHRLPFSTLRFPGGTVGNFYDYDNDAFYNEPCTYEAGFDSNLVEHFAFKAADYISLTEELGASTVLQLNVVHDDVQTSMDHIRDRQQKGMQISWLELGNENYLKGQACGNVDAEPPHDGASVVVPGPYIDFTKPLIQELNEAFPDLPVAVNIDRRDFEEGIWNPAIANEPDYPYDATVLHNYVHAQDFFLNAYTVQHFYTAYGQTMEIWEAYEALFGDTPMLVTEWGTTSSYMKDTYAEALITADMWLGLLEGHQRGLVQMAALHSPALRTLYQSTEAGELTAKPLGMVYEKLLNTFTDRSYFLATSQSASLAEGMPGVVAKAVQDGDSVRVFVVNKLEQASPLLVSLDGNALPGSWRMEFLQVDPDDGNLTFDLDAQPWSTQTADGAPEVPPLSVAVVSFSTQTCTGNQWVTHPLDAGEGSFRQAVLDVCPGDTIRFDPSLAGDTIGLSSGEIMINKSLVIQGLGADQLTLARTPADVDARFRLLHVLPEAEVFISDISLAGGLAPLEGPSTDLFSRGGAILNEGKLHLTHTALSTHMASLGGAIYNAQHAELTVQQSAFVLNHAQYGGGLYNLGKATLTNSTFSGNEVAGKGGSGAGIYNPEGNLSLRQLTIADNTATVFGGTQGAGLHNGGTLTLSHVLIARNTSLDRENVPSPSDAFSAETATLIDLGHNLLGDNTGLGLDASQGNVLNENPLLDERALYGGPTPVHALLAGSPAIDAGATDTDLMEDQRGLMRVVNERVDIGAYEYGAAAVRGFVLIDPLTDEPVLPLETGAIVNLTNFLEGRVNIRAITAPVTVGSVVFDLNEQAAFHVENLPPYALAGDGAGDYNDWWRPEPGTYTLVATPFSGPNGNGTAGMPMEREITFVKEAPVLAVTGLTLVDPVTDANLGPLTEGSVVDLANFASASVNVRAETEPATVGSVVFSLNDIPNYQVENQPPYAFAGDAVGDYDDWWKPEPGTYGLEVIPFTQANGQGEAGIGYSIQFEVVAAAARMGLVEELRAYPNPTTGMIRMELPRGKSWQLRLLNHLGQALRPITEVQGSIELDLSAYPVGLYILDVRSDQEWISCKVLKQ